MLHMANHPEAYATPTNTNAHVGSKMCARHTMQIHLDPNKYLLITTYTIMNVPVPLQVPENKADS